MKTLFSIKTLAIVLLAAGWLSSEAAETEFKFIAYGDTYLNQREFICEYSDVLRTRQGRNADDPVIHYLHLDRRNIKSSLTHSVCENHFKNLTNLDEQRVRDAIGSVLSEMKCEPGVTVRIEFGMIENQLARGLFPGIPHSIVATAIEIENCLTMEDIDPRTRRPRLDENGDPIRVPRPVNLCSMPCRGCPGNGLNTILEYDHMMTVFRDCRDAVNKIVEEENLKEQWARRGLLGGGEGAAEESLASGGGLGSRELGVMLEAGFGTEALLEELEREGYRGGTDAVTLRGLREAGADARLIGWLLRNGNGGAGR